MARARGRADRAEPHSHQRPAREPAQGAAEGDRKVLLVEIEALDELGIGVVLDWECPRHEARIVERDGRWVVAASGYPRPIPGVSVERNLKGISFAVANAPGLLALAWEAWPEARDFDALVEALAG